MQLQNVRVSRDERAWEAEIRAEIPADLLSRYRDTALKEMQKTVQLDGFRKGNAPIQRIIEIYGEQAILNRAAEDAIQHELPELLAKEKLLIVEAPKVTTDTPQSGKSLSFSARAPLAPEITLPDYKAIAARRNAEKEEVIVSEEEHREAMTHFRRERARIGKIEAGVEPQKAHEESRVLAADALPELDEEFVRSLGMESIEKFSEAVRSNIKAEKELAAREKRRAAILDDLVSESTIKYPALLKNFELDDMEARIKHDLERIGQTFDAYLSQVKKSREQLREEWADAADKRAKVRLILSEVARKEEIKADEDRLEREIAHTREHVPSADPSALRAHIAHALRNEKVLEFLEEQR